MPNMQKLKEDALRRKQEYEEKQRNEARRKQRKMNGGRAEGRSRRDTGRHGKTTDRHQQTASRAPVRKKPKKTPARWVIDTLLVLGTLIVLVMLFNPY